MVNGGLGFRGGNKKRKQNKEVGENDPKKEREKTTYSAEDSRGGNLVEKGRVNFIREGLAFRRERWTPIREKQKARGVCLAEII